MVFELLLAAVLAASAGEPAPAPNDDEARIEELMGAEAFTRQVEVESASTGGASDVADAADPAAEGAAPAVDPEFPPPPGSSVEFDDLPKLIGYPIRVHIGAGVRAGNIEKASKTSVTLRSTMGGGYAKFTLAKSQITAIEVL